MFGAFFIITDPVSSAVSNRGRLVFGALIGVLVYLIRVRGQLPGRGGLRRADRQLRRPLHRQLHAAAQSTGSAGRRRERAAQAVTRNGLLLAAFARAHGAAGGRHLSRHPRPHRGSAARRGGKSPAGDHAAQPARQQHARRSHPAPVGDPLLQLPEARPIYRARRGRWSRPWCRRWRRTATAAPSNPRRRPGTAASPACACSAHRETPGLGDAIDHRKSDWVEASRQVARASRRRALDRARDGGAFDQFTGATITPRAVVAGHGPGPGVRRGQPCSDLFGSSRRHARGPQDGAGEVTGP
jgi:electron transport complex protein RnfG